MYKKKIILGCMNFGGGWNTNPISKEDEKTATEAIETALECGIDTFDHADIYAGGKAETVFGRILKSKPELREKIKIQTKAGILLRAGINESNIYNSSRKYIENQVLKSLENLETEYLDTFLIHRPDVLTDVREIAETFDFLREKGLVREFGVSNMSVYQMKSLYDAYDFPLVTNQIQFSLHHSLMIDACFFVNNTANTEIYSISGMLEYSRAEDFEIQAWSPLAKGFYAKSESENQINTSKLLTKLALEYQTNVSAILLAWIFKLPANLAPIIGTTNNERIKQCSEALKINLSHDDWYNLYLTAKGLKLP